MLAAAWLNLTLCYEKSVGRSVGIFLRGISFLFTYHNLTFWVIKSRARIINFIEGYLR